MKIGTVSINYSRKFNLGHYESIELGCSLWAQVEDEEDADGVVQFLYHQAKAAVKEAAMPVIKANEFQISKAKSQRKVANDEGVAELDNF
jgi:predicted kinase